MLNKNPAILLSKVTSAGAWSLRYLAVGVFIALLWAGCAAEEQSEPERPAQPLFSSISPQATRIDFANTLYEHPSPHRNEILFEYFSNGGGVAVGDVNGDGWDDLYFSGNMGFNRLYLNRGKLSFEDISTTAGVGGRKDTWKTGITMADVNGDNLLDLYVSYSGDLPLDRRVDQLFINQGNDENGVPRFVDQAEAYGLAHPHSSNQAYFFDYDRDNDLDLFLLTHNVKSTPRLSPEETRAEMKREDPVSGVRFYRNDGNRFVDVTLEVGIVSSSLTYGLGAGISDIDNDGWMDMYVGNDYSPPDYLYMNNGDGTFTDEMASRMGHTSNASMGIDVADLNNDGWFDVVVLDMLAEDSKRQKTLFIPNDRDLFDVFVESGFHHQYMRNTLQLNIGDGVFSEVGQLAGMSNTDWSWTPLIADYDNDGKKDLFVTNGIFHDTIDRDFLNYKSNYFASRRQNLTPDDIAHLMSVLPSTNVPNYMFKNEGAHQFSNVTSSWGLGTPLKTTGAAYSDLDNDGDLDLITNNINEVTRIFRNNASDNLSLHYLQVALKGEGGNTLGVGAKVVVYANGDEQHLEQMPTRGYLSSVSPVLHFGLGDQATVDSLRVIWPDGRQQVMADVQANQRLVIPQKGSRAIGAKSSVSEPFFEKVSSSIAFAHSMAGEIDDFDQQPLLVHPLSFVGPAMAKADVNADGLIDVFVGGGNGQAGALYLQQADGRFRVARVSAFENDRKSQDAVALFVDVDNDQDEDLYIAGGGYGTYAPDDEALQDRLYINNGQGGFTRSDALPRMITSTGAIASSDINGDGWPDLFVGGRVVPGRYPSAPKHYVLINDGEGRFMDETAARGRVLQEMGMVSDAQWHDLNGDGQDELIVVGEWMPIRVFQLAGGVFEEVTDRYFDHSTNGFWNELLVEDLNRDGFPDLVVGNMGLNTQFTASENKPAELFYDDFNNDGSIDLFLSYYIGDKRYPYMTLNELAKQMPQFASTFPNHATYADATTDDILANDRFAAANALQVHTLETTLFLGQGDQPFVKKELPIEAQFSPVFAITALDANDDGYTDLFLGGNIADGQIRIGKYDASYGTLLLGDEDAAFAYVPQYKSGFQVRGDVRNALLLNEYLMLGINRGEIQLYKYR